MSRTVVIGAGVIGLLAAYELVRRGEDVIVFDKGQPGAGCSAGNAGWIVPSFSAPLPAPGLIAGTLRSMVNPKAPLRVEPSLDVDLVRWLREFWRHCNVRDYEAGYEAVALLNRRTLAVFDALAADGVRFEMHRAGLLFAFLTPAGRDHHLSDLGRLPGYGYAAPRGLSREEVRRMEPALSSAVIGGVFLDGERHVRPETLVAGLRDRLGAMRAAIRPDVEVTGVVRRGTEVRAVVTRNGEVETDRVLLAAGAWSGVLARRMGFSLPLLAGKGYSITVQRPVLRLRQPVHLGEARVACSPFHDALRVAGTVELSSRAAGVSRGRIAAIREAANRYLRDWTGGGGQVEWMGMRPFLPDGLPAIGRAPGLDNVYVAAGHGVLGITLAPVTAAAVAELMIRGQFDLDLAAFDPGRFARRGGGRAVLEPPGRRGAP